MREKIENVLIERVVTRQETTNEKILREIAKTLSEIGDLLPSQYYTMEQQLKYNESLDKIIKILTESTGMSKNDILKLFEERAKIDYEFAEKYYDAKNKEYLDYDKNVALKNKVNEIAISTFDEIFEMPTYSNISRTTGITFLDINGNKTTKGIADAYKQIVDDAIMNVSMGKETFYEALTNQLNVIGQSGIQQIEYKSGYHRRIDSALRMNLQDGLTQLSMAQQEIMGEQFGADGVEITVHDNPAPDHAYIQGRIFTKEEFEKLQAGLNAEDIEGETFQLDRVIGQWNCYHQIFEIVIGVDEPRYSNDELQEIIDTNEAKFTYENKEYTIYEATQKQRQIELAIRQAREAKIMQTTALNNTSDEKGRIKIETKLNRINKRIDNLLEKYHDFSKKSGLSTRLERTRILTKK